MHGWTHDLFLCPRSTAVGRGEGRGTQLGIPGELVGLTHRANGDGVGANSIAVTVAAVTISTSVASCPHKYGAQTASTLCVYRGRAVRGRISSREVSSFQRVFMGPGFLPFFSTITLAM